MKKLIAVVVSALTLGAYAGQENVPVTFDTSSVPVGTEVNVEADGVVVGTARTTGPKLFAALPDGTTSKGVKLAGETDATAVNIDFTAATALPLGWTATNVRGSDVSYSSTKGAYATGWNQDSLYTDVAIDTDYVTTIHIETFAAAANVNATFYFDSADHAVVFGNSYDGMQYIQAAELTSSVTGKYVSFKGADSQVAISSPTKLTEAEAVDIAKPLIYELELCGTTLRGTVTDGTNTANISFPLTKATPFTTFGICLDGSNGNVGVKSVAITNDRKARELTLTDFGNRTYAYQGKSTLLGKYDTILIPSGCTGSAWSPDTTDLASRTLKIQKSMNLKTTIKDVTIDGSGVVVYAYSNSSFVDGATVTGTGSIRICDTVMVNGAVSITGAILWDDPNYHTPGCLKLADGATLTVAAKLDDGKVTTEVENKVVAFDESTKVYFLIQQHTITVTPVDNTTMIVMVNGEEVTPEGDNTIKATDGSTIVVTYSAAEGYIMTDKTATITATESTTIAAPEGATPVQAVAKIDTTLYPSLAAAVGDAGNAQTITIIGDVSSEKVAIENKVIYISGAINSRNVDCECEVPMKKEGDTLFGDLEMAVAEVTSKGYSPFVNNKSVLFKMHKGVKIESDIVLPPYANTNSAIYFDATYCGMDEQTLDLNGHTISQTQGGPGGYWWSSVHVNCATVRIVDTSKEQTGKITGIGSCITITGYDEYMGFSFPAQVTLESGTLTVTGKPQKAGGNTYYAENGIVGIFNSGKFIMTGGKIDAVTDLDPEGKIAGVIADGANTTYGKPSVTITGGEIIGVPLDHLIERKSGIPLSTDGVFAGAIVSEKTIKISGGTFSTPINLEYCADDYYPTVINGVYGVCTDPVAKIGDMYYATLQGAADAAENGDTIVFLCDNDITGLTVSGKAVVLEFNDRNFGIDPTEGTSIVPAVNAECVTKLGTWKKACLIGDFEKCVDLMANTELNKGPIKTKYNFGGYLGFFVGKDITLSKDILLPAYNSTAAAVWFVAPEGDAEKGLTLELNGHEIRQTFADNGNGYTGHPAVNSCTGYLTINDSSDAQTGAIIGSTTALGVRDYTMKATGVTAASHMTLNGGTIITQGGDRATAKNLGYCVAVYGTFVMNGGTLKIDETKNGSVYASVCSYYESSGTSVTPTFVMNGGNIIEPSEEFSTYGSLLMYGPATITDGLIEGEMTFYGETTITGGSFKEPVDEDYWPSGYAFVKNAETGLYTKVEAAVCVVDEDGGIELFTSLKDAFAAADGKTVKLLKNQQLDVTKSADSLSVPKGATITFDLNGYILAGYMTASGTSQLISNSGTLTLKDSSDTAKNGSGSGRMIASADPAWQYDGSDNYSGSYASNGILNKGKLTIESGYYENATSGSAASVVDNNSSGSTADLTVNGGWLYQWYIPAVRQFANSATYENNVTINGGIVEGYRFEWIQLPGSNASVAPKATLTVNGGDLKSTQASGTPTSFYTYSYGNSRENTKITIDGGVWYGTVVFSNGNEDTIKTVENIEITGGCFVGDVYTYAWWYGDDKTSAAKFIKGGCFATLGNWRYGICPGYGVYYNEDPLTMVEFPYEVRLIPVVELTVTENDVPIKVREENLTAMLEDEEIVAKLSSEDEATREAAEKAVSEKLHTTEENGLEVWQNYVLGLDATKTLSVEADGGESTISLIPTETAPTPNSGFTVSYTMDYTDTEENTTTVQTLDIDLAGEDDPTGVYQVKALLTPDNGGEAIVIKTNDKVGIINAKEKAALEEDKTTIAVAVPFDGATVANVVNTKLLNEGDTLMAFVGGAYAMWTLDADGSWASALTVRAGGTETAPGAAATELKRGTAVWVTSAGKVVALGKYNEADRIVTAAEGVNLMGNPKMTEIQIMATAEKAGDGIVLMDNTRYTVHEVANDKVWLTMEPDEKDPTVVRPVVRKPSIGVGKGYWHLKK